MAEVDVLSLPAPEKSLALYVRSGLTPSDRPLVVLLHGARRTAANVLDWIDLLAEDADVILVDLPGHGRSEAVVPATLEALTASVLHALRTIAAHRRVVLVGESLGGLVALAVAGDAGASPVRAVVACDPPMSTAKLWTLQANFLPAMTAAEPPKGFLSLAWEVFGLSLDRIEDRIHYPLLDRLRTPATIVSGDIPLFPARVGKQTACVFDEVDRYLVGRFYPQAVDFREVAGAGHLVLADAPQPCLEIIREVIARHAGA